MSRCAEGRGRYGVRMSRMGLVVTLFASLVGPAVPAGLAQAVAPRVVVTRDGDGATTVHATRIQSPIAVDGRLDEQSYSEVPSISDFLQQEPEEGQPATEKTEVWLFYDDRNVYISARCEDSQPDRAVANEMRRDGQGVNDNESFAVLFDSFHDRRNGFVFQVTLAGGISDGYVTDERELNRDWNTVWDARVAKFEGGWAAEMVIPFKSLRFKTGAAQEWGVNFKRIVRWKNESQYLTRIPASLGRRGLNKVSSAATLLGLEVPASGRNYEAKPYGIVGLTASHPVGVDRSTDGTGDGGLDVKVGVTEGLTADFTYNTDFAQVEDDEQQSNLTRFSVLFPEKREFFLEGSGIFSFGGVQAQRPGGGGGAGIGNPNPSDVPVLFFSRRIGLNGGQPVPIDVGGRLTGKAGPYSIGLLDIRTGDAPVSSTRPTNFGVVRVKRDILRRSAIGVLFTDRSTSSSGGGGSRAFGVDGAFSFFQNLNFNTYVAKTETPGEAGRDTSYRAQLDYNGDRYGVQLERLAVDERFIPDVGFKRRSAFTRNSAFVRFSPRPARIASVRRFSWDGTFDYVTTPEGALESRLAQGAFRVEFQNSDFVSVEVANSYESLTAPFEISRGVVIPTGSYSFPEVRLQYGFGTQRKASGAITLERGSFYGGTRTSVSTSRPRVQLTSQLSVEPGLSVDRVTLPEGTFTTTLVTTRTSYTLSPRMSVGALVQYSSSSASLSTNARFRWEYTPGSDFFVVYTDNRDTSMEGFPELRNRGLLVKFTRLFRF